MSMEKEGSNGNELLERKKLMIMNERRAST